MKTLNRMLLLVFLLSAGAQADSQNKSLPSPTSDLQTIPNGSYVIAMDNTLQLNANGFFNLKAYGLVTHLLNNNIRLRWVIKAGKTKDQADFSGNATQKFPVTGSAGIKNFKAGPFVIYPQDTTGVAALVTAFYTTNGLTGNDRPRIYNLNSTVPNADIRYDMLGFKPKVIVLSDGGNAQIHLDYMVICNIPSSTYASGPATNLYTRCFTFASEPHNGTEVTTTIAAIRNFVQHGGNFLAQCAAVATYENSVYGRFHTTTGITTVNSSIDTSMTVYPNPDLSYTQFEGTFDMDVTGSVRSWNINVGGSYINNTHNHATGGSIAVQIPVGASVAKLTAPSMLGGLVFYLGNHKFSELTSIPEINGIRMYMNAMLTPVAINSSCNTDDILPNPLPVKLSDFTATLNTKPYQAILNWSTLTELNSSHFSIERSSDGIHFREIGVVAATGNSTQLLKYNFTDDVSSIQAAAVYYRLKQVDINGKSEYSGVRVIRLNKTGEAAMALHVNPNPATNNIRISVPVRWTDKRVLFEILNASGMVVKRSETASCQLSESFNLNDLFAGVYILRVACNNEVLIQKIVKH